MNTTIITIYAKLLDKFYCNTLTLTYAYMSILPLRNDKTNVNNNTNSAFLYLSEIVPPAERFL